LWAFFLSCGTQQELLSNNLQEEMSLKRVINDSSGQQVFYITNKSPRAHKRKLYSWYRNHSVRNTTGNYSGLLLDDVFEKFDKNYLLQKKGTYKEGVRRGLWQQWYANGNIFLLQHYDAQGRLHGSYETYSNQQDLLKKGYYRHGKKQGVWIEGKDTLRYKKGKIFIKDTLKPSLFERLFKKKKQGQSKPAPQKIKNKKTTPNFFKRLFAAKKPKNSTKNL